VLGDPGIAWLGADRRRIRLSAVEESKTVFDGLSETGRYAFTHIGQLDRVDGGVLC